MKENVIRWDDFKIREHMARQKIGTFGELAEAVGVSPNTITSWRKQGIKATLHKNAICYVLQCQPEDIDASQGKAFALLGMRQEMIPA